MRTERYPTATMSAAVVAAMTMRNADPVTDTVARLETPEPEPQVVLVPGGAEYQPEPEAAPLTPHPATGKTPYAYRLMCRDVYKQVKRQRRFAGQSPDDRDAALAKAQEKRARREGRAA